MKQIEAVHVIFLFMILFDVNNVPTTLTAKHFKLFYFTLKIKPFLNPKNQEGTEFAVDWQEF